MLRDSQECSMEWIVLLTMLESTFRFILDLQDNDISYNIWDEAICSYRGTEMVPKPPTWVNLLQVLLLLPNNSQLLFHMLKLLVCGLDLLLQGGGGPEDWTAGEGETCHFIIKLKDSVLHASQSI